MPLFSLRRVVVALHHEVVEPGRPGVGGARRDRDAEVRELELARFVEGLAHLADCGVRRTVRVIVSESILRDLGGIEPVDLELEAAIAATASACGRSDLRVVPELFLNRVYSGAIFTVR